MQEAGADALELNVYQLATDPEESALAVEDRTIEMVRAVRGAVKVPLAVKLSPFYTALGHFARRLDGAGADGLVLFNRFYQPEIDIEELQVRRRFTSPAPRSCPCASAGWPSCPEGSRHRWRSAAACTPWWT